MRNFAKHVALVVIGIALALLVAELALRIIGFSEPVFYQPDPKLGWIFRPGTRAWYTGEGRGFVEVNSVGMRDREHERDKPDGVHRIVVLGDSYSEARQVPVDSTYWSLLPNELARCGFHGKQRVEVLNFSVSGYGTAQELILLRELAGRYQPDLVLLQFTGSNDIRNNSRSLEPGKNRPFFVLNADGTLHLDDTFASLPSFRRLLSPTWQLYRQVAPYSRLVQLLRTVIHHRSSQRMEGRFAVAESGLDEAELAAPRDPRWEDAWRVTEALIAEVSHEAERLQAKTLVVTVPWPAQDHPDPREREAFARRAGLADLGYADRRIEAFGRAHNIPVLALALGMSAAAERDSTFLHGFGEHLGIGHWNTAGHRVAAGLIADALCSDALRPEEPA